MSETWRLSASYSFMKMSQYTDAGLIPDYRFSSSGDPHQSRKFASSSGFSAIGSLTWTCVTSDSFSSLPGVTANANPPIVPSYITMDMRLAWQPNKRLELAVIGRNLLQSVHEEFNENQTYFYLDSEVERACTARSVAILMRRSARHGASTKNHPARNPSLLGRRNPTTIRIGG